MEGGHRSTKKKKNPEQGDNSHHCAIPTYNIYRYIYTYGWAVSIKIFIVWRVGGELVRSNTLIPAHEKDFRLNLAFSVRVQLTNHRLLFRDDFFISVFFKIWKASRKS